MIPLEIERKFLVKKTDAIAENASQRIDIIQTYLIKKSDDIQRRVRKITTDGSTAYTYTEKRFISASVREENERVISMEEYDLLISEADDTLSPVEKSRFIIPYRSQRFEADVYPFSERYATLELELNDEGQEIILPTYIEVIKEVTGDHSYSNAVLAKNRAFPDEEQDSGTDAH